MVPTTAQQYCSRGKEGVPPRPPILQLHPTRRCNLTCRHCYSSSSPNAAESLDAEILIRTLGDARLLGYELVAFSGGEPLLYPDILRVLDAAKEQGLTTLVASNGFPITPATVSALRGRVDLVALSLDGLETEHNKIRASPRAFAAVERAMSTLAAARLPFGLIATVTATNWHTLPDLVSLAVEAGAQLFHAHPLERVGRAASALTDSSFLSGDDLVKVFVLVQTLAGEFADALLVHCDLLHRDWALEEPSLVEVPSPGTVAPPQFGAVAPRVPRVLVVEPSGRVVPIAYGFCDRYQLGNLQEAPLSTLWSTYRASGLSELTLVCKRWLEALARDPTIAVFNWTEHITAWSKQASPLETVRT